MMTKNNTRRALPVIGLLLFSIITRLYAFKYTYVINNDGVLYLDQAHAILEGKWDVAKSCGYNFISLYHLLIPVFYKITGDWIVGAKSISLLFGTLAVVPLYVILRQFLPRAEAFMSGLIFAVNPFFVSNSVELIKDPLFWFIALVGIFFFLYEPHDKPGDYFMVLSGLSFVAAGFVRFEIIFYMLGSVIYLLSFGENKAKRTFLFCVPLAGIVMIVLAGLMIHKGNFNIWNIFFAPRINIFFHGFFAGAFNADLFEKSCDFLKLFTGKFVQSIFFPVIPFVIVGFWSSRKELLRNRFMRYAMLLMVLSVMSLYLFYLKFEFLSGRYLATVILPSFIFIGAGVEKIIPFFEKKGLRRRTMVLALCFYIIIPALSANLGDKRTDKLIYKEIGQYISNIENNRRVNIMAPDKRIMFYANYHTSGLTCAQQLGEYESQIKLTYPDLVAQLKQKNIHYFLWEERSWENAPYDFLAAAESGVFKKVWQWKTNKTRFIAFKVID